MECFVLLTIMSNPQQPRGINEEDMKRAIEAYSGTGDFLKKILKGETGKKVENFLGGQQMAMHDYEKDPELIKNLYEIINTPGYDPDSVREAQRQILRIRQGLPRFPTA